MYRLLSGFVLFFVLCSHSLAAPDAKEFGTLETIYDAAISPDGEKLAIFLNFTDAYGIKIVDLNNIEDGGKAVILGEGIKPSWITWANNERVLASIWDSQEIRGTPFTTGFIYSLDTNDMKGELLIKPEAKRGSVGSNISRSTNIFRQYNNVVVDFLEDDPDHILMSFSDVNVNAPDIQKVNVATGNYQKLRRGRETIQYWYTDLRGEPRVGQGREDRSKEEWNLLIRDAYSDDWRSDDDYPGLRANSNIYGFTSDPNEMVIGDYAGKDTLGLYVYDLSQKRVTRKLFHHDTFDAGALVFTGDGKDIAGASYISDDTEIELFDEYDSTLDRLRAKLPGYSIDYVDQSSDGRKIIADVSNAYDPGMLVMIDAATDKITRLAENRQTLPSNEMGEVIPVKYKARDGERIPAYVTLPPSITDTAMLKDLPFIVLPHGGPYARDSKRFDYFSQFFATRGYGVLQMNFRGSSGYGKTFQDAGRDNWVVMQEDVEDGAKWLVEKGYADSNRMCIAGWSYGGYAALMGAINNPDLYNCTISMAGVTDLGDMINDIKKYRFGKISAQNFVLRGFDDKADRKRNSPVKRAEEIKVPVFLAHGEKDQRVHFDQFKRMKKALEKADVQATFVEFDEEDHFLSNQKNRQKFFVELEKFLEKSNGKSEFMQ